MRFYKKVFVIFLISLFKGIEINSQTLYFPLQGITADYFSSAFGPRNKGGANYPASGYDYDFHGGIDIASPNGTNVYPVADGTVYRKITDQGQNNYIVIQHIYNGQQFYVKYMHLTPSNSLSEGSSVTANTTIIGTLLDYPPTGSTNGDHLDFRYYQTESLYLKSLDNGCYNPGEYLTNSVGGYIAYPKITNATGYEVIGNNSSWSTDIDNNNSHSNPSGRRYIQFGVSCTDTELDIIDIQFDIFATSHANPSIIYTNSDILYDGKTNYSIGWVNYDSRENCGDRTNTDDDVGHNSTTIGIYPTDFNGTNDHLVYFRWYINETVWNDCESGTVKANVAVKDWGGRTTYATMITVVTCVCPPEPGAPSAPQLTNIIYDETAGKIPTINLTWQNSSSGAASMYRIYRCISNQTITDNDFVGIAPELSGGTSYFTDRDPTLIPGVTYRYAVAGVHKSGVEGPNSNELTILFKGELPQIINENATLTGTWLVKQNFTISSGYTLSVGPSTLFKVDNGKSINVLGKLVINGTSVLPVFFTSSSATPTPGSWGSIVLSGSGASGSNLNGVTIQYGTQISVINANNVTIQNCNINNVTQGIYFSGSSNSSVKNNTLTSSTPYHGIRFENGSTGITCYQNTVKKTGSRSGVGILFGGGSGGTAWQNDIRGWSWGMGTIYGSSPNLLSNLTTPWHNNRITDCTYGMNIYANSWPTLGGPVQGSGYNSLYANTYNIRFFSGPPILYAYSTYWGVYPNPAGTFLLGSGSTIDYNSPLATDPWQQYPLPKISPSEYAKLSEPTTPAEINSQQANSEEDILEGVKLRLEKGPKAAMEFFKSYIAKYPNNQAAYVELYNCVDNETIDELTAYFSSLPKKAAKEHELLLSYLYLKQGNIEMAKKVNNNLIEKNPNTRLAARAKLNNAYIALYNENKFDDAVTLLRDISARNSLLAPMELSLAQQAVESYAETHGKEKPRFPNLPKDEESLPTKAAMEQNFPNPFNPSTTISYALPKDGMVTITIYDLLGREVRTLVNEFKQAGRYTIEFNADNLASGVYIYKLTSHPTDGERQELFTSVKKMLLVR